MAEKIEELTLEKLKEVFYVTMHLSRVADVDESWKIFLRILRKHCIIISER